MLIVMTARATQREIDSVVRVIESLGFRAHPMPGVTRTAIGVTGNPGTVDIGHFENLPGVAEAVHVTKPYKLTALDLRPERTIVDVDRARSKVASRLFLLPRSCSAVALSFSVAARSSPALHLIRLLDSVKKD